MLIRRYQPAEVSQIARLYFETVHRINARDHTARQLHAWAPRIFSDARWACRLRKYTVYVAEQAGVVTGFAEFEASGHID